MENGSLKFLARVSRTVVLLLESNRWLRRFANVRSRGYLGTVERFHADSFLQEASVTRLVPHLDGALLLDVVLYLCFYPIEVLKLGC